eukprot:753840-Hanusia_phi.AAC.2
MEVGKERTSEDLLLDTHKLSGQELQVHDAVSAERARAGVSVQGCAGGMQKEDVHSELEFLCVWGDRRLLEECGSN